MEKKEESAVITARVLPLHKHVRLVLHSNIRQVTSFFRKKKKSKLRTITFKIRIRFHIASLKDET